MKPTLITWIERVNRNLIILGVAVLVGGVALFSWQMERIQAVVVGPPPIEISKLSENAQGLEWVEVQGERAINTGYEAVGAGNFVALEAGEHLLLVKARRLGSKLRFQGRVKAVSSGIREEVISTIEAKYPNTSGHFLPVMVEEASVESLDISVVTACLALAFLSFFLMYKGARGMEEPQAYPSFRRVIGWDDPREVLDSIEQELKHDAHQVHFGGVTATANWLIARGMFKLELAELRDLAWLYKEPQGWNIFGRFTLVFCFEKGERLELPLSEEDCDRLISEIAVRVPWIVTGYNRNIEILWISDRQAFLSELHSRRDKATVSATA